MADRGYFITFEGGEGAGKTTLIDALYSVLTQKGLPVLKTREPGGTAVGQEIRNLLLHTKEHKLDARCELFLFLADRAQHVQDVILPALQSGGIVLCDRFTDSTLAYQGEARGFPLETVKELCNFATTHLKPNLTLYLDLDPLVGFERTKKTRKGKDRIESEEMAFHLAIRKMFCKIAQEEPRRVCTLDASLPPEKILYLALERINALLTSQR